jgi:ferritin
MISQSMEKALSRQLNDEFFSAYLYLAMSAYCSHMEFSGAAHWFKTQYDEEHQHATRIYNYLIDQGVHVELEPIAKPESDFGSLLELEPIAKPESDFGSLLEVFKSSLTHEQKMTASLNELSDQALKEKDHATYNLLQWFVNEQVEEEATVGEIISKLKLVKEDGYGLLMIDNELARRVAVSDSQAVK